MAAADIAQKVSLDIGGGLDGCHLMVISHDCDVLNPDLKKEPFVEFLLARRVAGPDQGELRHGKSPRALVFDLDSAIYRVSVHEQFRFDRQILTELTPSVQLAPEDIRVLRYWLALRYTRAAFPDEFNERTRSASGKIYAALKKNGAVVSGMYLVTEDRELSEEGVYVVDVLFTMRTEDYADGGKRVRGQELLDLTSALFDSAHGVEVSSSELRPESHVSLDDLRVLKRWEVGSLSLRASPGEPTAPDAK